MGIFSFFKKKQNTDLEFEPAQIQYKNLKSWLQTKKSELSDKESVLINQIQDNTNQLIQELEQEIQEIKQVNLDEKPKIEERIKMIVQGNLDNYTDYLTKLIKNLKTITPDIITLIDKTNTIFSEFEKKSNLSYQKATILVGKELEKTKTSIANFFRNLNKILKENGNLILLLKTISFTEEKLKEISQIDAKKTEIQGNINNFQEKLTNTQDKITNLKKEIKEIEKSEQYKQEIQTKKDIQTKEQALEKQIQELKQEINFKELANIFHSNETEMKIIKDHKEKFKITFNKDNGKAIIGLLDDAKLTSESSPEKINQITLTKQEIQDLEANLQQTETKNISSKEQKITNIKQEIESLKYEKTREENQQDKINKTQKEMINTIKQELGKVNTAILTK
jgi:hypothetical protein